MKIVIAGAGEVGFHLAKLLADEAQDIVLIDSQKEVLEYANTHLDVRTILGDSTSLQTLRDADIEKTDLLIAATSSDNTNLLTAIIGKKMGALKTIARSNKAEYIEGGAEVDFELLGVDSLISPVQLAASQITELVEDTSLSDIYHFENGKLSLLGITLEAHAPIVNQTIIETSHFNPQQNFKPIAVQRKSETIIPTGSTEFKVGDHVYFIARPGGMDAIREAAGIEQKKVSKVMIMGGGRVGKLTAQTLEKKGYKVTLIERNKKKCLALAEDLNGTLIINGDGSNVELLEEEGIGSADVFVALTGNSEINIISSLVAKNHNVARTIALVENPAYVHLSHRIGVDNLINRKLIAANDIFKHIRKGSVKAIASLGKMEAEVIEYEVQAGAKITHAPIKDIGFPREALIGGIVRADESFIPFGDFLVKAGDRVVVFALPEVRSKVEELFG